MLSPYGILLINIQILYVNSRYIYNSKLIGGMSSIKTLQKCRKIMSLFDEMKPSNKQNIPNNKKSGSSTFKQSKSKIQLQNSRSKSKDLRRVQKPSKELSSKKSLSKYSLNSSVSYSNSKSNTLKSKQQFQNPYNKMSRFQKIMKLKVHKPQPKCNRSRRNSYLQSSLNSSMNSSITENQLNFSKTPLKHSEKKLSRYEKIMRLKIHKPNVQSTLKNYQPERSAKKPIKHKNPNESSVLLLKQCKQKINKQKKQVEKQDRLWKLFEREREIRVREKNKNQEKQYEREMSLERRFDYLVRKELRRIQGGKQREQFGDTSLF